MSQEWKLVPVEPTGEMRKAWQEAPQQIDKEWSAMLAAAPMLPADAEVDFKSDENALEIFSKLMAHKLAQKSKEGRSGWQTCSQHDLTRMLREHVEKGDPVDAANFCMMLSANGFRIGRSTDADASALDCASKIVEIINGRNAGSSQIKARIQCAVIDAIGAHVTRLQAENAALQQRLTIADQRVDDLESKAKLEGQLQRAAEVLPEGWMITIEVERDGGGVTLIDPMGNDLDYPSNRECLADEIEDAIEEAISQQADQ